MARFLDSTYDIKKEAGKKTNKKDKKNKVTPIREKTKAPTQEERQNQKSYGTTTKPTYTTTKPAVKTGKPTKQGVQNAVSNKQDPLGINRQNSVQNRYDTNNAVTAQTTAKKISDARQKRAERQKAAQAQKSQTSTYNQAMGRKESTLERYDRKSAENIKLVGKKIPAQHGKFFADYMRDANPASIGYDGTFMSRDEYDRRNKINKIAKKGAEQNYERLDRHIQSIEEKQAELQKGESRGFRNFIPAEESAIGMISDFAIGVMTGLGWGVPLYIRSAGGASGEIEKKGGSRLQDRLYSNATAAIELGTERMGGLLGKAGVFAKGRELAAPLTGKASDMVTRAIGNGTVRDIAGGVGKYARGGIEETLEEYIANPAEAFAYNVIYGNKAQKQNVAAVQKNLTEISDNIRKRVLADPDSAALYAETVSSPEHREEIVQNFRSGGMSKAKAEAAADLLVQFEDAAALGDIDRMKDIQDKLGDVLAEQTDPRKKVWDWDEMLDVTASTLMMTGALGLPGAVASTVQGREILNRPNAREDIMKALRKSAAYDGENGLSSRTILDKMESDPDYMPTATQASQLMESETRVMVETKEKRDASDRAKANIMRGEDLLIPPAVTMPDGSYVVTGEVTRQKYDSDFRDTMEFTEMMSGLDGEDAEIVAEAVASFNAGSLTPEEIFPLAHGSGITAEARGVFGAMTGIDVNQYDVKDRKGRVNVTASNQNMMDGLLTRTTENYVRNARIEQANWNDEARGAASDAVTGQMLSEGKLAAADALSSVDPRDKKRFLLMSSAVSNVYDFARNTMGSWSEVSEDMKSRYPSLDQDSLRKVFESAKEDKITEETPYLNAATTIRHAMSDVASGKKVSVIRGHVNNNTNVQLKGSVQELLQTMASDLNIDINIVDDIAVTDSEGNTGSASGSYKSDGVVTLNINNDSSRWITFTLSHEITHHLKQYAPLEFKQLLDAVKDRWYRADPEGYKAAMAERKGRYSDKASQQLSDDDALEEIIGDASYEFWTDIDFMTDICEDNPSLARKIIDAINAILQKIRSIISSGRVKEPSNLRQLYSELDFYDEAKRLWLSAYSEAKANAAVVGLIEWDERARNSVSDVVDEREQVRFSVTTDEEDKQLLGTNDYDKISVKDIESKLEENFDEYKEDKENLRIATEAIDDLQRSRFSIESTNDGGWGASQVRTIAKGITSGLVHEGQIDFNGRRINGPEDLAKLCQVLRDPRFETFRIILTKGNKIVSLTSISARLPGVAPAHEGSDIKEGAQIVADRMKQLGADGYYLLHNHPSGDVSASYEDLMVSAAYINMLGRDQYKGHVILDHDKYGLIEDIPKKYAETGEMLPSAREEIIKGQQTIDLIHEPEVDHEMLGAKVASVNDIARVGHFVNTSEDVSVLVYLTSKLRVAGIQEISNDKLLNDESLENFVREQAVEFGARISSVFTRSEEVMQRCLPLVEKNLFVDSIYSRPSALAGADLSSEDYGVVRNNSLELGLDRDERLTRRNVFESAAGVSEYGLGGEADVRFSISEENRDALNKDGVDITESGSAVRFSLYSWQDTDIETLREKLHNAGFDEDRIDKWIKDVNSIAALIAGDMKRLNYTADQFQDALKPNVEYYYTLDLSTLCQKRRLYQGTYNKIMRYLVNNVLLPEDTVRLRAMMDEMGYEVPCGICYEESRKKNEGKFAERWLNGYGKKWKGYKNQEHTDPYIPTLYEVTTTEGREKLREEHPEAYESYVRYQKTRGSANPKISYTHTDYRGDILRMTEGEIEQVKHIGGLRIQSFSDFEIPHVIDMMQAVMDMSAQNLTAQAYTKVPAFAEIFGGTGIKINLSLIGRWNPETEQLEFDAKEGIDSEKAFKLREKYSQNVGTILVGSDDISILKAWADPRVDMVIPFHRSGWSKKEFEKLGLVGYKDYTKGQTERYMMGKKDMALSTASKALGLERDDKLQPIYSADYWDKTLSGKENAERYLALCAEKHYRPVFYQFLHDNGDGTWSLQEDGSTDGYWKSLIDFKMYDNEGNYAPQELVQPVFDMDAAQKIMEEYEGGADTLPVADDVVEAFLKEYKKNHPKAKFDIPDNARLSISVEMDDAYMDAVNAGDMEEAQRLVDKAAKAAGYVETVYHGTGEYFNVFRLGREGIHLGNIEQAEQVARNRYHDRSRETRYKWGEIKDRISEMDLETRQSLINRLERTSAHAPIFDGDISDAESVKAYAEDALQKYYGTQTDINYRSVVMRTFDRNVGENVMRMYARLDNPFVINGDILDWTPWNIASTLLLKADGNTEYRDDFTERRIDISGSDLNLGKWTRKAVEQIANGEVKGDDAWRLLDGVLEQSGGYHGIKYLNQFEGDKNSYSYIALNRNDVKLADTVTYAEDGSVIPLSERFDPSNNDIRYSLPTTDSYGNVLSDGQMEYFKNSQARDEQGRLLVLYHGTSSAGFNIFRADRLIWLTTSRRDADSYGGNWEHKIYDPEEREQRVPAFGGSYRLDNPFFENFRFDTEEDLQDFIDTHPDIDKIKSDWDLSDMLDEGEIDEDEYDRLLRLGEEYEKDYRRYEFNRFGNFTWGDLMDNPEKFTKDDFYRAILAWDKEASVDDMDEVTIEDFLSVMQEEEALHQAEGGTMRDMPFRTRIPEGEEGEYVYPVNQRTYEVYANLINPLIVDIRGRGIEGNYGYVDDMIAGDYDGLILRNCRVGRYHDIGDAVIARQPEQVKDTRNENPTENPDIRYSITPKDEAYGHLAQVAEDIRLIPLADPALENQRVRYAMSEETFVEKLQKKWNEGDLTHGMVLAEDSVKKNIIRMMKYVMKESGTGRQYNSDTLEETMKKAKVMFHLMKKGDSKGFAEQAWKAAERIVDDINYNDDLYEQYKEVTKHLAGRKIQIPDALMYDEDMAEFVSDNRGRMKLLPEGSSVEAVYKYLNKRYPQLFVGGLEHPVDMLMQMDYALDYIEPYKDAYTSEEYTNLVEQVATTLSDIVSQGKAYESVADVLTDKYEKKVAAMKLRHTEAMRKARQTKTEAVERERIKTQRQKERTDRWKQKYSERVQRDIANRKEKRETREHRKRFDRIYDNYNTLCKWVLNPAKDHYVPEEFRKVLAEVLQTIDLQTENSKNLEAKTGHPTQKTLRLRQFKDRLADLVERKGGEDGTSLFEHDLYIESMLQSLSDKLDKNGNTIDALDSHDINEIDTLFKYLIKNIQRYNTVRTETRTAPLIEIADSATDYFVDRVEKYGKHKAIDTRPTDWLDSINVTSLTPAYLFDRMGPLKEMYETLRYNGFDSYIRNESMIIDKIADILSPYYKQSKFRKNRPTPGSTIEEWRDSRSAQTFDLTYGSVTMSVAQMMSLYCLDKRGVQATDHIYGGGIVVTPIQVGSKAKEERNKIKGKADTKQTVRLTPEDVNTVVTALTPEQKEIADKLQQLLANEMAALGNEAHRELYGYEIFNEPDYFPIKVEGTEIATDINNVGQAIEKIKSFGPAKPLTPHAQNKVIVDDIFKVVADNANGMNLYASYLVPITDFMKVWNYTKTYEDGTTVTLKAALKDAYGDKVYNYILNLLKDINGIKESTGVLEDIMNEVLGKAKRAAVLGNFRVAIQQPTTIIRACAVIDAKYFGKFLKDKPDEGIKKEMYRYCPIAQWKSWGYYDTYMGRDIEDVMMNKWSKSEVALAGIYGELDNWTWSLIWRAVKAEQAEAHPEMDTKSEEFLTLCGRRASEVFDKTQIVDSTFHRSDAMRSTQVATKTFTAFMSEPTLTLNVFRAGLYNAAEARREGDHAKAARIMGRTMSVLFVQAVVVSMAQALADAWRGKDPGLPWGDDEDEEEEQKNALLSYLERFVHNFAYNLFDQLHLENNMYLVKDVAPYVNFIMSKASDFIGTPETVRAIMGWNQDYLYNQNNLIFSAFENTANGFAQIFKKLEKGEDYDKDWYDIVQKTASGIGTMTGFPVGPLMRDFGPIIKKVFAASFAADELTASETTDKEEKKFRFTAPTEQKQGITEYLPKVDYSQTPVGKAEAKKAAAEKAQKESEEETKRQKAFDKLDADLEGLTGAARDEALWDRKIISGGYGKAIEAGDWKKAREIEHNFLVHGGSAEFIDQKRFYHYEKNYMKTIKDNPTNEDLVVQARMQHYLLSNGMTEEELSAKVKKSQTAKDLKAAFRLNDIEAIKDELQTLKRAGLTFEDFVDLYEKRNYGRKEYKGKYKDRFQSTGTYVWPVTGRVASPSQVNSGYGRRSSPGGIGSTNHQGIDLAGNMGEPVGAADGGTVVYVGWYYGAGKTVMVEHDDGTVTQYSHLSNYNAKVGDTVGQGQTIGNVGSTGNSTGPHLHFAVKKNGAYVDPTGYILGT